MPCIPWHNYIALSSYIMEMLAVMDDRRPFCCFRKKGRGGAPCPLACCLLYETLRIPAPVFSSQRKQTMAESIQITTNSSINFLPRSSL